MICSHSESERQQTSKFCFTNKFASKNAQKNSKNKQNHLQIGAKTKF